MKRRKDEGIELSMGGGVHLNEKLREIYLFGTILPQTAMDFTIAIRQLDETPGTITIIMSSPGGSEPSGWAIYEAIRLSSNKTAMLCIAECMSISALILQAPDIRAMAPNCRFMTHDGSIGFHVDIGKLGNIATEVKFLTEKYYSTIASRAGKTVDVIREMGEKERFLSATECLEYGIIDAIVSYRDFDQLQPQPKPKKKKNARKHKK